MNQALHAVGSPWCIDLHETGQAVAVRVPELLSPVDSFARVPHEPPAMRVLLEAILADKSAYQWHTAILNTLTIQVEAHAARPAPHRPFPDELRELNEWRGFRGFLESHQMMPPKPSNASRPAPPLDLDAVESYRVEPEIDAPEGGNWHVLRLVSGKQIHILTRHPLVIVEPEQH